MKLTLDDIADLRAYEREREAFRERIIALKRVRRVSVGPVVTLVFENRDTVRFQVQEMARAERLVNDQQVQAELDVYNPLIPEPGQLSATLFVELTSDAQMREWLPTLVGIERAVELRIGDRVVRCVPEEQHERQLTREEITASVHYVRFELTPEEVAAFDTEPVVLAVEHPDYREATPLSEATRASLSRDLHG
ncbi:MAG TPA: DUF3501 family protein [Acidimicrobiales bacterium]|nr:DUF3501 family protein [Acidimicrobiales bacterium]